MNGSLIDGMLGQLQGAPLEQIAQHLGTDSAAAQNAVATALPMIVGALGHNAQQPGGAGALLQALQDHSDQGQGGGLGGMLGGLLGNLTGGQQGQGGLGGMLGGLLGNLTGGQQGQGGLGGMLGSILGGGAQANPQPDAGGILGHIFGDAQSHAQAGLGQATGIGAGKAGDLLAILAPMVMAHVANHAQTNNLDADGLSAALGQEKNAVQSQGGVTGDLLGAVLSRI